MVPLCSEKFYLWLFWSSLVHATLAALGTIFQAYPAPRPCEPRRPLGDMQAVSCGARSRQYSRLLSASSSQPRSIERAGSGPMGRVHTYYSRSSDAPRSPCWARHLFVRRHVIGLCGWDVAPPRRRGRPSGARASHLFSGGVSYNQYIFKHPFGHHYY